MARKNKLSLTPINFKSTTCAAKRGFMTEQQAQTAAEYQMLLKPSLELSVYNCGECGKWHLTRRKTLV